MFSVLSCSQHLHLSRRTLAPPVVQCRNNRLLSGWGNGQTWKRCREKGDSGLLWRWPKYILNSENIRLEKRTKLLWWSYLPYKKTHVNKTWSVSLQCITGATKCLVLNLFFKSFFLFKLSLVSPVDTSFDSPCSSLRLPTNHLYNITRSLPLGKYIFLKCTVY